MSTPQQEENRMKDNELIAEFMNVHETVGHYDNYGTPFPHYYVSNGLTRTCSFTRSGLAVPEFIKMSKYHESWDWLMPVVEKIYSLGYFVQMQIDPMFTEPASCVIIKVPKHKVINSVKREQMIDAVYASCVHFIKWYNNQPKP